MFNRRKKKVHKQLKIEKRYTNSVYDLELQDSIYTENVLTAAEAIFKEHSKQLQNNITLKISEKTETEEKKITIKKEKK